MIPSQNYDDKMTDIQIYDPACDINMTENKDSDLEMKISTATKRALETPTEVEEKRQRVITLNTNEEIIQINAQRETWDMMQDAKFALQYGHFNDFEDYVLSVYVKHEGKLTYDECLEMLDIKPWKVQSIVAPQN